MTGTTGSAGKPLPFPEVKQAALNRIDSVLAHWVPNGKRNGNEYVAPNPTRTDNSAGSFSINLTTGVWSDFATGDKGGDLIDLVAYVAHRGDKGAAVRELAEFLNIATDAHAPTVAAPAPAPAKKAAWEVIQPIPEGMKPPSSHHKLGAPARVWVYKNAAGQPLFILNRFDITKPDGSRGKEIMPLTWCRNTSTKKEVWRWQGVPAPRPLYQLDKLAQNQSAPVIVCEGEKAAQAAGELMPDWVATCWPNGTNAWNKADFSPLKGRAVALWADNDEPGRQCMKEVAQHLRALGAASVQTVSLQCFESSPAGAPGAVSFETGATWPAAADAADAQSAGWTPEHVQKMINDGLFFKVAEKSKNSAATKPATRKAPAKKTTRPAAAGFEHKTDGLYAVDETGQAILICTPIKVLGHVRDANALGWGLLVELADMDGNKKRWNVPFSAMDGDSFPREVAKPLADMGLILAPEKIRHGRDVLHSYLQAMRLETKQRFLSVERLGWHGDAYLLPDTQIGKSSETLHFCQQGQALPEIKAAEPLETWTNRIGRYCAGNASLVFFVATAFAGPLLKVCKQESGGFHFYGKSSKGKTTHLKVAASVWGTPRLVRSWRSTDNALEHMAAAHSDGLLILDEIGQCNPNIIGETVYMLGNGKGKSRANDKGSGARPVLEWQLLFLSTGESTLADHMTAAGKQMLAGMDVRMLGIPADSTAGEVLALHDYQNAGALIDALKARTETTYGAPIVAFLEKLISDLGQTDFARALALALENYTAQILPESGQTEIAGQVRRAAARFALVVVAGELATGYGITGWPEGETLRAAKACFAAWLERRGTAGNLEDATIIQTLRLFVEQHLESRWARWEKEDATKDDHEPRTMSRLGFRKTENHGVTGDAYSTTTLYCFPEGWRQEIFKGHSLPNVNKLLISRGIVKPGNDGKAAQSVRLPGMKSTRCYVVDVPALMAEAA